MKNLDDCNSVIDPLLEFAQMLQISEEEKRQLQLKKESEPAVHVEVIICTPRDVPYNGILKPIKSIN